MIATFALVAIDCPDPRSLAEFYSAITGWPIDESSYGGDWVQLRSDAGVTIAFQRVDDHRPPVWPGAEHPQQMHLDFDVDDLDAAESGALELGARRAETQPDPAQWRVFIDPAGHPFCLVLST